jgi:hypothetical protein
MDFPKVRRWVVTTALAAACSSCGIPPYDVEWAGNETLITPDLPTSTGKLLVETAPSRYRVEYADDRFLPTTLPIGRYTVVTKVGGEYRRARVLIMESLTTRVLLRDFPIPVWEDEF